LGFETPARRVWHDQIVRFIFFRGKSKTILNIRNGRADANCRSKCPPLSRIDPDLSDNTVLHPKVDCLEVMLFGIG
jgi:hypothetical protein